jgi:hypothetical protein
MANISVRDLSNAISELLDLELVDLDQQSTIELALNRAISAQEIVGGLRDTDYPPMLCGIVCPEGGI